LIFYEGGPPLLALNPLNGKISPALTPPGVAPTETNAFTVNIDWTYNLPPKPVDLYEGGPPLLIFNLLNGKISPPSLRPSAPLE